MFWRPSLTSTICTISANNSTNKQTTSLFSFHLRIKPRQTNINEDYSSPILSTTNNSINKKDLFHYFFFKTITYVNHFSISANNSTNKQTTSLFSKDLRIIPRQTNINEDFTSPISSRRSTVINKNVVFHYFIFKPITYVNHQYHFSE